MKHLALATALLSLSATAARASSEASPAYVRSAANFFCGRPASTIVTVVADHLTAGTTMYTVTVGKTLYVFSLSISAYNTSTTRPGRLRLQDAGTVKVPVSIPPAGLGAALASTNAQVNFASFPVPKAFTTAVNMTLVSGTLTYSASFTGCEE